MRKDKTRSQSAVKRDLSAIALPTKLPLAKLIAKLQDLTYTALKTGNTADIERICKKELLDLLDAGTEVAILKGGRRGQLSSEKVIDEPAKEIIPVRFSLQDEGTIQAQGTSAYLKKVSGLDPTKTSDKFKQQNAGLINGLSKEICDTIKKTIADLTRLGVHVKGGKQEINNILVNAGLDPTAAPRLAETIFRTQTAAAYNAGRWNVVNDSDTAPYIWGFEYCTVGDRRVRPEHRLLEGVRLPKDDPFWKKYLPPNGWNCRCTVLEIWNDEDIANIDFGITGVDPRKRSDKELNLLPAFAGNVGVLSQGKPSTKTSTPKPSVTTKPTKPVKPVTKPVETKKPVTEPIPVTQPKKEEKKNESQKPIQSTPGTANPHTAETQTEEVTLVYDIKPDIETFNRSNHGSKTFNLYVVPVEGGKEFDIQDWKGVTVGKIKQRGVSFGVDSYRWEGRVESSLIKQSNAILDVLKAVLERVSKDRYNAKVTECALIYGKKQGTTLQLPDTWEKFVKESRTTVKQLVNLQPKVKNPLSLKEGNNYNLQWNFNFGRKRDGRLYYGRVSKKFNVDILNRSLGGGDLVSRTKLMFDVMNQLIGNNGWKYVEFNKPVTNFAKLINLPEYNSSQNGAEDVVISKTDETYKTYFYIKKSNLKFGIEYEIGYNRFNQKYIVYKPEDMKKSGEIVFSSDSYEIAVKWVLDKLKGTKEINVSLSGDTQKAENNLQEEIKPYNDVLEKKLGIDSTGKVDQKKLNTYIDSISIPTVTTRSDSDCDKILKKYGVQTEGRISVDLKTILSDVLQWIEEHEFSPSLRLFKSLSRKSSSAGEACAGKRSLAIRDATITELENDAKSCYSTRWWSSDDIHHTFIHEDTHDLMNDICEVLGSDRLDREFKPILDKIGAGVPLNRMQLTYKYSYLSVENGGTYTASEKKEHDIYKKIITEFSAYGATISASGSIWQEACAEARAEVLCKGKNARPFAREIYAKIIELYIEAKNKK